MLASQPFFICAERDWHMRSKLTEAETEFLKKRLVDITIENAGKKESNEACRDDRESVTWRNFSLDSPVGYQVYSSFKDEELIAVIRKIAVKLNHSPARKEVFWPFRDYAKRRFRRWPYVMERAGISRSAGKGGPPVNKDDSIK
ncbi:MAG: homing endonuclease associated repeat-containing protein [Anaerovoracaceae bacterium]